MKLLFDENLSRRLVDQLSDLFPFSSHLAFEGLLTALDIDIWEYAKSHGYAIVSADHDFYQMAINFGPPPKVIWLRECDYPTRVALRLIRNQPTRIMEFADLSEDRSATEGSKDRDRNPRKGKEGYRCRDGPVHKAGAGCAGRAAGDGCDHSRERGSEQTARGYTLVYTRQARIDAKKIASGGLKPKAGRLLKILAENPYQTPPP